MPTLSGDVMAVRPAAGPGPAPATEPAAADGPATAPPPEPRAGAPAPPAMVAPPAPGAATGPPAGPAAGAPSPFGAEPTVAAPCTPDWSTVVPQPAASSTAASTTNRRRRVTPGFFQRPTRRGLSVPLAAAPALRANPPTTAPSRGPLCAP